MSYTDEQARELIAEGKIWCNECGAPIKDLKGPGWVCEQNHWVMWPREIPMDRTTRILKEKPE